MLHVEEESISGLPPMRGLGDAIAWGIDTVTGGRLKPCGGCKRRQKWLNEKVPFTRERKKKRPVAGTPTPGAVKWGEAKPIQQSNGSRP